MTIETLKFETTDLTLLRLAMEMKATDLGERLAYNIKYLEQAQARNDTKEVKAYSDISQSLQVRIEEHRTVYQKLNIHHSPDYQERLLSTFNESVISGMNRVRR